MVSAVEKLDSYLAQGLGQDFEARLDRLAKGGADTGLVKTLERIINAHGFVEFRPTLAMIIDRLESTSFEIALFGRVSSGKSSLLNCIVQTDILPVGVNPITTVPTRLIFGDATRLTVWYADRKPQLSDMARLPELVSEQHNPGNTKHVTRIVVELPSARLRQGIVLVDTPGLGSLATAGAAETLAYLPHCDLGVVLIDAGSTLTEDDLATLRTLYEAGIPATVLLSKSDLLVPEDRLRSLAYISEQMRSQLGLAIPIHPVSTQASHSHLLEAWLSDVILPLYDRYQQLAGESLSRKIGSLREGVVTALKISLDRAREAQSTIELSEADHGLRQAVGRLAEIKELCFETTRAIRVYGNRALAEAAGRLTDAWLDGSTVPVSAFVHNTLVRIAAGQAMAVSVALSDLASELARALQVTSDALGLKDVHRREDLNSAIKEMPRLDLGELQLDIQPGLWLKLVKKSSVRHTTNVLRRQIGPRVTEAFSNLGSMLDSWARHTVTELQFRFESHADAYRAHLARMSARDGVTGAEHAAITRDLAALAEVSLAEVRI
jgi:GTP-binding protein EngB required for normal cell division